MSSCSCVSSFVTTSSAILNFYVVDDRLANELARFLREDMLLEFCNIAKEVPVGVVTVKKSRTWPRGHFMTFDDFWLLSHSLTLYTRSTHIVPKEIVCVVRTHSSSTEALANMGALSGHCLKQHTEALANMGALTLSAVFLLLSLLLTPCLRCVTQLMPLYFKVADGLDRRRSRASHAFRSKRPPASGALAGTVPSPRTDRAFDGSAG